VGGSLWFVVVCVVGGGGGGGGGWGFVCCVWFGFVWLCCGCFGGVGCVVLCCVGWVALCFCVWGGGGLCCWFFWGEVTWPSYTTFESKKKGGRRGADAKKQEMCMESKRKVPGPLTDLVFFPLGLMRKQPNKHTTKHKKPPTPHQKKKKKKTKTHTTKPHKNNRFKKDGGGAGAEKNKQTKYRRWAMGGKKRTEICEFKKGSEVT